jgi:hypothetical protein
MAINNIPNLFQPRVPGTASMPITYDSTPSLFNIDQAQVQQAINQKKIDEEQQQRKRLDQQSKLQNLADTFRMIEANKSGNVGAGNVISDRIAQRKALAEQKQKQNEFLLIPQSVNRSDYDSNRSYYAALGQKYLKSGYLDQGLKLLELGKPTNLGDFRKDLIGASKTETTTFNATNKGVKNFQQLLDAAQSADGAASYALMIKFIKQLDDSVVREGEVATFGGFQGALTNLKNQISKTTGSGFTPEVKSNMINLAAKTANRLVEDYNNYRQQKNTLYEAVGLPTSMVFAGLDFNLGDLDLTKSYSPEDFQSEITGKVK